MEPQGQNAQLAVSDAVRAKIGRLNGQGLLPLAYARLDAEGFTSPDIPSHRRPATSESQGRVPWRERGLSRLILDRLRAHPMRNRGSLLQYSARCL